MAGLGIVHAQPVDQNQRLLEGGAANREVGLHALARTRLQVQRWVGAQQIDHAVRPHRRLARQDHLHRAIALGQRQRLRGRCHLHALLHSDRTRRLGNGRLRPLEELCWQTPHRTHSRQRERVASPLFMKIAMCSLCGIWVAALPVSYVTRLPSRLRDEVEWACEHIVPIHLRDPPQGRAPRAHLARRRPPAVARGHRRRDALARLAWCARASMRPTPAPIC